MSGRGALELVRGDDFVEFFLFPQLNSNCESEETLQQELNNVLQQVNEIVCKLSRDYIWHKDEFVLTIRTDRQQVLLEANEESFEKLPPHLYGISYYGDNIQDEWFVVYLLFEVSKKVPGMVIRVADSDGEFLLIEAANFLPKWANPDTCHQRVYIHNGDLHLVQNSPSSTTTVLSVATAVTKIRQMPTLHQVPPEIKSCIDARLKEFYNNNANYFHHQRVRIPAAISVMLKKKPSLIAPACRAFCERDSIDMKACRAMRFFPPENRVKTVVKFTRCLYAMITNSNYAPDRRTGWDLPAPNTEEYKEDLLGVKIACGFEILASQAKEKDDIENDRSWKTYQNSLVKKGYFRNNVEGSIEYSRLMHEAKEFYRENLLRFRTASVVGKEILTMLSDIEVNMEELIEEESQLQCSDDDNWLNISPEELDAMLTEKYGMNKMFTGNGTVEASELSSDIVEFLDRKSEFDGVDDSSLKRRAVKKSQSMRKAMENSLTDKTPPKNSNDISFDPDAFQTHVKNFLDFVIPEDEWDSASEMSDYEDDDELDKNIDSMANGKCNLKTDLKAYMDQMDRELAKTTIGKTFETAKSKHVDDFDDIETFTPIDIDVNTLRNMVDSYKHQIGGPGPATNLLGALGIGMAKNLQQHDSDSIPDLNGTQV